MAAMNLSRSTAVSRFSTGSGLLPGASAAVGNRCASGTGAVASPPHATSATAVRSKRSRMVNRTAMDPLVCTSVHECT
jgi:hypothetical protein